MISTTISFTKLIKGKLQCLKQFFHNNGGLQYLSVYVFILLFSVCLVTDRYLP